MASNLSHEPVRNSKVQITRDQTEVLGSSRNDEETALGTRLRRNVPSPRCSPSELRYVTTQIRPSRRVLGTTEASKNVQARGLGTNFA